MITINEVLFFDTETTGIPNRSANWETDYNEYPHIVQLSWMLGTKVENHIIYPDGWEVPRETTDIHGITTEYAKEHGEPFTKVVDMFINDCHEAAMICGHNIHFDTSIVKANILRELGRDYYDGNDVELALWKGKRIDTMLSSMKWVDARFANGRLKFPNLTELYSRCFPDESFPAHNALEDVKAVARCLPILLEQGLVELKLREYSDKGPEKEQKNTAPAELPQNSPDLHDSAKDGKLPIETQKAPQIENLAKISTNVAELLEEDNF